MKSLSKTGISIYIPSFKRGGTCETHKLFEGEDYRYVVRESDKQNYSKYPYIAFADEEINSLSKVRQKIIDISETDYVLQVDDDISDFIYKNSMCYSIVENYKDEIIRQFQIIEDLKIGFWSVSPTANVIMYKKEFDFKGVVGGCIGINKKYFKSKYDASLFTGVDIDVMMQELVKNRIIWMPNYFGIKQKRDVNEGGNNVDKNSNIIKTSREILKIKWGKNIDINNKKNVIKIMIIR